GDTTLKEILPLLNERFGKWKAPRKALPGFQIKEVPLPGAPRVFLVDQPGALQANILAGQVVGSALDMEKSLQFNIANGVVGGKFTSRLNMNLREEKHWAYGSYSFAANARGQRPWMAYAAVQIDKTVEALEEMRRDIAAFATNEKPATAEEIVRIKTGNVLSLPGAYETADAVMNAIGSVVRYGYPDNAMTTLKQRTEAVTDDAVRAAAATIKPDAITWVVVGDLSKIEEPIRALGIGEVSVLDADGKKLR